MNIYEAERLKYMILTSIYEARKDALASVDAAEFSPERVGLKYSYWLDIFGELIDAGYISGVTITDTQFGRVFSQGWQETVNVTAAGRDYLRTDKKMRACALYRQGVRDFTPDPTVTSLWERVDMYDPDEVRQ